MLTFMFLLVFSSISCVLAFLLKVQCQTQLFITDYHKRLQCLFLPSLL